MNLFKGRANATEKDDSTISITQLLQEANNSYSHITRIDIEKIRLEHRLKVVQGLEDHMMKNVVRSVQADCPNLSEDELKLLFAIVKNEQLQRSLLVLHKSYFFITIMLNINPIPYGGRTSIYTIQ